MKVTHPKHTQNKKSDIQQHQKQHTLKIPKLLKNKQKQKIVSNISLSPFYLNQSNNQIAGGSSMMNMQFQNQIDLQQQIGNLQSQDSIVLKQEDSIIQGEELKQFNQDSPIKLHFSNQKSKTLIKEFEVGQIQNNDTSMNNQAKQRKSALIHLQPQLQLKLKKSTTHQEIQPNSTITREFSKTILSPTKSKQHFLDEINRSPNAQQKRKVLDSLKEMGVEQDLDLMRNSSHQINQLWAMSNNHHRISSQQMIHNNQQAFKAQAQKLKKLDKPAFKKRFQWNNPSVGNRPPSISNYLDFRQLLVNLPQTTLGSQTRSLKPIDSQSIETINAIREFTDKPASPMSPWERKEGDIFSTIQEQKEEGQQTYDARLELMSEFSQFSQKDQKPKIKIVTEEEVQDQITKRLKSKQFKLLENITMIDLQYKKKDFVKLEIANITSGLKLSLNILYKNELSFKIKVSWTKVFIFSVQRLQYKSLIHETQQKLNGSKKQIFNKSKPFREKSFSI